jgi:hypothetical protein
MIFVSQWDLVEVDRRREERIFPGLCFLGLWHHSCEEYLQFKQKLVVMVVVGLLIETERGQGNFWCEDKRNNG